MEWSKLAIAIGGPIVLLLAISTTARAEYSPTACQLLSPAEVEHALHVPVGAGSPRVNSELVTSCLFTADGGGTISILLRRNPPADWIAEQRQRMTNSGSFRPVSGVGGSAFGLDSREQGAALCVFLGEYYLQISVFRLGNAGTVLPVAEELARQARSRLRMSPRLRKRHSAPSTLQVSRARIKPGE
jgi:hypothetical protein